MGNCQGWLHLDRFNKIIILFRMIFRMIFCFFSISFYSISRFKLVDFLQDACTYSTYSPRAPPAPQKSDQSTRRRALPLLTTRNSIPNPTSLLQFGICANTH